MTRIGSRANLAIACLLLAASLSPGQSSKKGNQKQKAPEGADQTIKVAVEMVSLPVVVSTKEGRRVTDLTQKEFRVYEDGVIQEISGFAATDEPVTLVFLLDTSGSTEQKLALIQNEAIKFVNLLHPDDSVAIVSFSDDVTLLEDFSIDRDRNAYGIKETRTGGWTVLYEAVWLALEDLLKPIKERKALVLFTDGVDTRSHKVSQKETIELARESSVAIYSVYYNTEGDQMRPRTSGGLPMPRPPVIMNPYPPVYGPGSYPGDYGMGRAYLRKLAEETGGMVFDASETDDLETAFEQVARELASQYSIGYYSTNAKQDGKFRKVEVKVDKPGLAARTKRGYYPKKAKGT